MSEKDQRWCIMRDCTEHPTLAPWPITVVQLGIAATHSLPSHTPADDARVEIFVGDIGHATAFAIANEMDRPRMRHAVVPIESLRFDVWLHNHYDGSTHVQAEGIEFDDARLLFLACVGFATLDQYWKAEIHVPCDGHRDHWRLTDRPVDVKGGRWDYDAREATVSPSRVQNERRSA